MTTGCCRSCIWKMEKVESFSGWTVDLHALYQCAVSTVKSVYQSKVSYTHHHASLTHASYAAFTLDTCSPRIQVESTCIHLYRLSTSTCILYRRQNCRHDDMYPLVSGYKLLVRDTCRRLHVSDSGVNAALLWTKIQFGFRRNFSGKRP